MKRLILIIALFVFSVSAFGQDSRRDVVYQTGAPSVCADKVYVD